MAENSGNEIAQAATQRAGILFAGAIALVLMAFWIVARDYNETRATADLAEDRSSRNEQSITTLTTTQKDLLQLQKETQAALRRVEIEQARRGN